MTNYSNRPRPQLSLPTAAVQTPPAALPDFPTPWCVGPYGSIWVAADVKQNAEGKWVEDFCARPRCVVHAEDWNDGVAEYVVAVVNGAAGALPKPPC